MNGNPLDKVKRTFGCLQKEHFGQMFRKFLSDRTRKGCVLVDMPIKKDKTIEPLCNFKACVTKCKAYFPWLNSIDTTHIVSKSKIVWSCFTE